MVTVPSSPVVTVGTVVPFSTERTVTLAPETEAPCGSVTLTVTCPVSVCASATRALCAKSASIMAKTTSPRHVRRFCFLYCWLLFIVPPESSGSNGSRHRLAAVRAASDGLVFEQHVRLKHHRV